MREGLRLFEWTLTQEQGAKHVIFLVHGFGEHSGRYLHFPKALESEVFMFCGRDQRGHGHSAGRRGDATSFDALAQDLEEWLYRSISLIRARHHHRDVKCHVLAHSMGSLVALRTLTANPHVPIDSVILSAPFLGLSSPLPKLKELSGQVLRRIWGSVPMKADVDVDALSRDPLVRAHYLEDPLVHGSMSPRFFFTLREAQLELFQEGQTLEYPSLWLVPLADRVCDPAASMKLSRQLGGECEILDEGYHEIFNDVSRDISFLKVRQWLKKQAST
jgi:alpha-beta hydrolase superfamily lysophospholipase